jgi:hypothetical protein
MISSGIKRRHLNCQCSGKQAWLRAVEMARDTSQRMWRRSMWEHCTDKSNFSEGEADEQDEVNPEPDLSTQFIHKLKSKITVSEASSGTQYFDWEMFGKEAMICFNSQPNQQFLAGFPKPKPPKTSTLMKMYNKLIFQSPFLA